MARKVFVSSDMAHDERLIEVAETLPEAALLWPWFVTYFDDWGRAEAHPKRIKAQLFPMNSLVTPELIEKTLRAYADVGLVILYEIDGKAYMAVPPEKWWKYQTHIHKSKRENDQSRYPAPPSADSLDSSRSSAESRGDARVFVPSPSPSPSLSLTDYYEAAEREEEGEEPTRDDTGVSQSVSPVLDQDLAFLAQSYRRIFNQDIGPTQFAALRFWREEKRFPPEVICEAMKDAADKGKRFAYAEGTLRNWDAANIRTLEGARQARNGRARAPTERRLSVLELVAQAKGGVDR